MKYQINVCLAHLEMRESSYVHSVIWNLWQGYLQQISVVHIAIDPSKQWKCSTTTYNYSVKS